MILLFEFDYRTSSQLYERLFIQALRSSALEGCIEKEHFSLKLYVDAPEEILPSFIERFTGSLPHSLFLYAHTATVVNEMPASSWVPFPREIRALPFCPSCLQQVNDPDNTAYGDIFTSCDACGYDIEGEHQNYLPHIEKAAELIASQKTISLTTMYDIYTIGIPSSQCNNIIFDILCYDLATIERYTNASEEEIKALGSFEKPFVALKTTLQFLKDYESLTQADIIRFKLPDDLILQMLMQSLHERGINAVFLTQEEIAASQTFSFVKEPLIYDPIEIVVSDACVAIVEGDKGLPSFEMTDKEINPASGALFSIIKEQRLEHENIAGIYLSKEHRSRLIVYGKKYGIVPYMTFEFTISSIASLFEAIAETDETGNRLLQNYQKKFPEHYKALLTVAFDTPIHNLRELWGIVALILDHTDEKSPSAAGEVLLNNAQTFLGKRGPRIDYKNMKQSSDVLIDPLPVIRSAMSFRLAGVDPLMLSYGVVESFVEFLSNEFDTIKQTMGVSAICAAGSLFGHKPLFAGFVNDLSKNHPLYFNNELPIDGINIFYGGDTPNSDHTA